MGRAELRVVCLDRRVLVVGTPCVLLPVGSAQLSHHSFVLAREQLAVVSLSLWQRWGGGRCIAAA